MNIKLKQIYCVICLLVAGFSLNAAYGEEVVLGHCPTNEDVSQDMYYGAQNRFYGDSGKFSYWSANVDGILFYGKHRPTTNVGDVEKVTLNGQYVTCYYINGGQVTNYGDPTRRAYFINTSGKECNGDVDYCQFAFPVRD